MTTQPNQDLEQLNLLSIFHYVVGVLAALFSSIFIIHTVMGAVIATSPELLGPGKGAQAPPAFLGWFMFALGAMVVLGGWSYGAAMIFAGRSLAARRRYLFCVVMAGLSCMFAPFGTILGVFTIVVLMRPSVKALFGVAGVPPA